MMNRTLSKAELKRSISSIDPLWQHYANSLSDNEKGIFDRNITRLILLKASICSVLLICMNLSILLVIEAADSSFIYLACTILSAGALITVYLIPTAYCAMLLTQAFTFKHLSRRF